MRGQTLETMLRSYRNEVGLSTNPQLNLQVREAQVALLRRHQEFLCDNHKWPFMREKFRIPVEAGISRYSLPALMNPDRCEHVIRINAEGYETNLYGVIGVAERNVRVEQDGEEGRNDVTQAYDFTPDGYLDIWPVPHTSGGFIEIEGFRMPRRFVEDDDRSEMDDQVVVLLAAAETLSDKNTGLSRAKLAAANARLEDLKKQDPGDLSTFTMGGGIPPTYSGNAKIWKNKKWSHF